MTGYRARGNSISGQLKRRQVVADAIDQQKVDISSMRFGPGEEPSFRVIASNEAGLVGQRTLDLLRDSVMPQGPGFEPLYNKPNDRSSIDAAEA
jgi:hypothetical protein